MNAPVILLLIPAEEIRELYENALRGEPRRLVWCSSVESLINFDLAASPQAIVLDLDAVEQPVESVLQQVKRAHGEADVIALSSVDSAQMALACVRSGCVDFLLKPTSPEELAWSLRKLEQRRSFLDRVTLEHGEGIRAINQIAAANTTALVHLYAVEYLKILFKSAAAAWVTQSLDKESDVAIACVVPREVDAGAMLYEFPIDRGLREPFILRQGEQRKVFFPSQKMGGVFLTGVHKKPSSKCLGIARLIVEHSELSLLNMQKFEEIKQQTFIDDVTGLYNSRYLKFSLTNAINRCKKSEEGFSVLFIDVDHFKRINDSHGHLVGSEFLIAISQAIKHAVRAVDLVFRYGGDEFVILLHQTFLTGAREIAERIRKHIERRVFVIQGIRIQTTVTIGLATYPDHATDKDELLRLADEAMYSAKRLTRNAVHLASK